MSHKIGLMIAAPVVFCGVMFISAVIFTFPVFFLWNWLMPCIFHLPELTFTQAWGLAVLSSLLFKTSVAAK